MNGELPNNLTAGSSRQGGSDANVRGWLDPVVTTGTRIHYEYGDGAQHLGSVEVWITDDGISVRVTPPEDERRVSFEVA